MLRAGVAGVGNLGKMHVGALLSIPELVSVDALGDPIEDRRSGKDLKTRGLNLGIGEDEEAAAGDVRQYDDFKPLCQDEDLDVVVIATPSNLHAPAAILAMENGKHVLTEKPMALNYEDCRRMIDASKANSRTLMVGQCLRFYPGYVKAHEIMKSGEYGKTLTALMNRRGGKPGGWFADVEQSGGVNLDLHIHDVDTALLWWGEPDEIMTRTRGTTDTASSVLSQWRYEDGPEVQIEASWDAGSRFGASFKITLERATLDWRAGEFSLITKGNKEHIDLSDQPGGHRAEVVYFIQCVTDGAPVDRCPPEESALAVKFAIGGQ